MYKNHIIMISAGVLFISAVLSLFVKISIIDIAFGIVDLISFGVLVWMLLNKEAQQEIVLPSTQRDMGKDLENSIRNILPDIANGVYDASRIEISSMEAQATAKELQESISAVANAEEEFSATMRDIASSVLETKELQDRLKTSIEEKVANIENSKYLIENSKSTYNEVSMSTEKLTEQSRGIGSIVSTILSIT